MMNERTLKDLLDKYLSGELSTEEAEILESWFEQEQIEGKELFEQGDSDDAGFSKDVFNDIIATLGIRRKRYVWPIAISVLLIVSAAIFVARDYRSGIRHNSLTTKQTNTLSGDAASWKYLTDNSAASKKFILPDGSVVTLYPNSELKYDSANFNVEDRKLFLSGKCFFDVAHNALKPFIVYSKGISTTALGTAFMINSYVRDKNIRIELIRGKIRIRQEGKRLQEGFKDVVLNAGEYCSYNFAVGSLSKGSLANSLKSNTKSGDSVSMTSAAVRSGNTYVYDRVELSKVLEDLKTAYHVDIEYKSSEINSIQFSGEISIQDNIQNILKKIGLLNNLRIAQSGKDRFRIYSVKN